MRQFRRVEAGTIQGDPWRSLACHEDHPMITDEEIRALRDAVWDSDVDLYNVCGIALYEVVVRDARGRLRVPDADEVALARRICTEELVRRADGAS